MAGNPDRLSMAEPVKKDVIMSAGFNQATLLGRLCAPPEELQTKAGKLFIKATIAVSVHRKNSDGIGEEHTSFITATMFGKTAELFLKYVQKGDMVHLAGRLDSNEWKTQEGKARLSLSFVVEQLALLPNERKHAPAARPAEKPTPKPNLNEYGEPDDIPF
jgi:single-strand DNA-binding protein